MAACDEGSLLTKLVESHADLEFVNDGAKVRVISMKHEFPPRLAPIKEYIESKSYKKKREWYAVDFSKYEPHIIQHKTNKKFLFCTLTDTTLMMDPAKVEKFVSEKKFQDAKKEFDSKETRASSIKEARRQRVITRKRKLEEAGKLKPKEGEATAADGDAAKADKKTTKRPRLSWSARKQATKDAKGPKKAKAAKKAKATGDAPPAVPLEEALQDEYAGAAVDMADAAPLKKGKGKGKGKGKSPAEAQPAAGDTKQRGGKKAKRA